MSFYKCQFQNFLNSSIQQSSFVLEVGCGLEGGYSGKNFSFRD